MKTRLLAAALLCGLLGLSQTAHAQIQKSGTQKFNKVQLGVHPLGVAVHFGGTDPNTGYAYSQASYRFGFDVAGKIADTSKLSVWLGGEFNIGGRTYLAILEPGIFVRLGLEKLLHIPLVPMVQFGISGTAFVYNDGLGRDYTTGAILVKFGGGVHYYLTKNIGLGLQTLFGLGGSLVDAGGGAVRSGFVGSWDFMVGAQFAF